MLSDQNKALVLRVSGNALTGSDAEWSNLEKLLDAAREEGRQSAGERVKALEDELRRHTEHLADFDRRYSMDSSSDVAAALYCAQRLLAPQAAPVEQTDFLASIREAEGAKDAAWFAAGDQKGGA